MATVTVNDASLSAIADAIREKLDVETTYLPSQMAAAIGSIETGGTDLTSADEGKVVVESSGEYVLAAQTSRTVSQNGTYDTTTNDEVVVNVSGGGGSTNILSGTEAPAASIGSNGDVYIRYEGQTSQYTPIEYLQSSGTQYIDTLFTPNQSSKIEIDFAVMAQHSTGSFTPVADCSRNTSNSRFGIGYDAYGKIQYDYNTYVIGSLPAWFGERYVVVLDGSAAMRNGVLDATPSSATFTCPSSLLVFASYISNELRKTKVRVFSLKLWSDATLVRDLVPALDGNNVACLYDKVGGEFLYNSGTGDFLASDVIEEGAILDTYLKVNGSWVPIDGQDIEDVNLGN